MGRPAYSTDPDSHPPSTKALTKRAVDAVRSEGDVPERSGGAVWANRIAEGVPTKEEEPG